MVGLARRRADGELEGAVIGHREIAQRKLGVHIVLVEVHVALHEREECLVHAVDVAAQHVRRSSGSIAQRS